MHDVRAKILFAFLFAGHAMDIKELESWTGSSRQGHYGHLRTLCDDGFLALQKNAHGKHVYLLGSEMLPLLQSWLAQLGQGNYLDAPADQLEGGQKSAFQTPGQLPLIEAVVRTPEEFEEINVAFRDHGILDPTRTELLGKEWMTAEYVRTMVEYEKGERQPEYAVGRAINKMRAHHPQPERRANGHMENCRCTGCDIEKFTGGNYGYAFSEDEVEEEME
jgi:hypothetical protein